MKEKTEDKILKLPPVEVAKMHQEYGRVIQFLPSGTASCPPSKTKFVRRTMSDEETKETFKKIEATRPESTCLAEKVAIAMHEELGKKLDVNKSE